MTIAVVIPCRNEAAHITGLLDALAAQTHVPDEVVIVDDKSTDDTVSRILEWQRTHHHPRVRVVEGPGTGPAAAMNAGVGATDADVIMRFDGHSVPAPDYLARCLKVWSDGSAVGVVGGVWHVAPGAPTAVARAIAAVVSHPLGSGGALYRSASATGPDRVEVETVPFGTFPRAVWQEVGGFDDSLAANEDFDFNYRVRQAGHTIVLDRRISATYLARPTLLTLARQYFRYGFWKVQMLRKDPRALHLRQVPPLLVLPWVLATLGLLGMRPGPVSAALASVYPLLVCAGALHVSTGRAVNPLAAAAAVATVHLTWSAGFWAGLSRGSSRQPSQSGR